MAIGAHPDDCELGAGATLAKHALAGDEVRVATFGSGRDYRQLDSQGDAHRAIGVRDTYSTAGERRQFQDQRFDVAPLRDLISFAELAVRDFRPDIVYTHSATDLNRDHRLTLEAVLIACRPIPGSIYPRRVLSFEIPGGQLEAFDPKVYVDVAGEPLARKMNALKCYASEMREFPHPRSADAVLALAAWRGATAGVRNAEAFELLREIA